jgi:type I restriction enzyme S subunit
MIEWKEYELGQLLSYEQPTPFIVKNTDYDDKYQTPVLTAGKSFIIGYTNEKNGIYNALPVIIFDDFTTSTQYVNFPFKVKSSAMKILSPDRRVVLPKFIYYRMQIIEFDCSTHKRYWIQQYSKLKVKIPPLEEQERIVARIEELFSELDKAIETLKTTKEQLAVYRDAVLRDVFVGDYQTVQLKDISKSISGFAFKSKKYVNDGGYVVVKIGNVKQWKLDFSRDYTHTNEVDNSILNKYLLQKGDCLITQTGSRGKRDYGYVAMIENQKNYLLNQRVAALRFNTSVAIPRFYMYYLATKEFRDQFFSYETGNVGQGNVGIGALAEPTVILPSIEKQERIIIEIESRLSVCDSIEQTVDTALQQAETMRQSILKQAFEGRLV